MAVGYAYVGSMRTRPGQRDAVIEILLRSAEGLRGAGCHLYLVATSADDPDAVWVTESWETKQHHDDSLQLPETRAAIAEAMPMLTGEFDGHELTVVGGLGS